MQRKRLIIRQTAIFGALIVVVTLAGLASAAMLTDRMEPIFSAPFASPSANTVDYGPTPCPVGANAIYPSTGGVTVNARNGSGIRLVAYVAAQTLENRGFTIGMTANAGFEFGGSVLVLTGEKGVNNAYLVLAQAPDDAVLAFDGRTDDTVDLIAGARWDGLKAKEAVTAERGQTIPRPTTCTEVPELVAANAVNPINPGLAPSSAPGTSPSATETN
jgi:hypothetical protein